MKKSLTSIMLLAAMCLSAIAQQSQPQPAQAGQTYVASQYAYLSVVRTAGSSSIVAAPAAVTSTSGQTFVPFNTNAPITLDKGQSDAETVTPSSVTGCYAGSISCTLAGVFSYVHAGGTSITSGTFGLQEAINVAQTNGSGTVLIDATWQGPAGSALITAASGSVNVVIQDNRSGVPVFYQWKGGAYVVSATSNPFQPVLNASSSTVAGSDIGARANTLFTQLLNAGQNGTVTIDSTVANGNQTTTITVPLGDTLDCQGATLNFPGTGHQIIYSGTFAGGTQSQQGKVKNCTLVGSGATATSVYAGGDPAGVITPSGNYGNNLTLEHDVIEGFATGYTHGSNSYNNVISNTQFLDNTNNIVSAPTNATNEGEATMVVNGSVISNATNCGFYLNNVDDVYYMSGGHLDYNAAGGVCGTAANIELNQVWKEQLLGPIVNVVGPSTAVDIVKDTGGQVVLTGAGTSADIWHVEGLFETQVLVHNQTIEQPTGTITNAIGVGATTGATVCLDGIAGPHGYGITGTINAGCKSQSPTQINYGASEAIFSPTTTYQTATQGWNITWNLELNSLSGEMDFVNVHGGGVGGFVFCDGAFNYTPSVCQFKIDTNGNTTATGNSNATQFYYPTVSAGPNGQEFSDLFTTSGLGSGAIGTPTTAGSFTVSSTEQDLNHPGNVALNSGFSTAATGIGEYFTGESSGTFAALNLNTAPGWTFDTIVYIPVLPATTAASYEVGLYHNPNILQNSGGGQGFYLSSTNANANHWYCSYGANVNTDSGVAATSAWTHLSMVQNGTSLLWYVNGAQVCITPIANVTSLSSYTNWKAVAQTETTAVVMYVDEFVFQRALTR
jgi:hypothetical protein